MRHHFGVLFLSVFRALFPAAADVCFVSRVLGEKEQVPVGYTITCYETSCAYLGLRTGPVMNLWQYFLHKEKRDEVYFISFLSFKSISAPFVSKNLYCRNEKLWLGSTFIPIPYFSLHCAFIENTPLFIYAAT